MKAILINFTLISVFSMPLITFADVKVNGYYRKDGTYVHPHYRSDSDGIKNNNWTTEGNVNPYTGKEGTLERNELEEFESKFSEQQQTDYDINGYSKTVPITTAQDPQAALDALSFKMLMWVDSACPRSLGPSLWSSCVMREASAASSGKPDLSGLKPDLQAWVINSCPDSLGPSMTISCLDREKKALINGLPNILHLTQEQKRWVSSSCPRSLGPSLYVSCIERESAALGGTKPVPK